jgi:hypothetical protein
MTAALRPVNFGAPRSSSVILRAAAGELSHRFASTSKLCAVAVRVRSMGISAVVAALSIWRAIRANFTRCVGILAGTRSATAPAADDPAAPEIERTNAVD